MMTPPFSGSMDSSLVQEKGNPLIRRSLMREIRGQRSSVSLDSANGYSSTGTDEALAAAALDADNSSSNNLSDERA